MTVSARVRLAVSIVFLCLGLVGLGTSAYAQDNGREALVLSVDGAIDHITQRYVGRGVEKGEKEDAEVVVILLNTPGGLLSSTEKIVSTLLTADVPTAVYVHPAGALAASAGTFVTTAANFAVMSESTSIGAASPVGAGGEDLPETLSEKATEIASAMVEGIAEKRGRNEELLISTVTEAAAFSANEAVEKNVVDFIATSVDDLLHQLHGREAETASGIVTLNTEGIVVRNVDTSLAERFLSFASNPNVIGILLTIGTLGIFFEILSPGLIVPGVSGAIALIIGLVALGTLPFNWAGIALLALAAVLIFFEIQVPGLGFLGVAGVIAFILGALLLFSVGEPDFPGAPVVKISLWLVGILSGIMALFALVVVTAVVRSRKAKYVSTLSPVVGEKGRVTTELNPTGTVQLENEMWSAVAEGDESIPTGADVEVVEVSGLTVKVRKV